jgi:chromate transporter
MGILGAVVALWVTFVPCFMWIFTGAPYIEWLNSQPRLKGALSGVTAAVVGVILNLSIWFALHVFFADVTFMQLGFIHLWLPNLSSLDWNVVLLTLFCGVLLLKYHCKIPNVLAVSALSAYGLSLL